MEQNINTTTEIELSLIVPAYNEQDNIVPFCEAVAEAFKEFPYDYELIFVDDGSTDQTFERLQSLASTCQRREHIQIISFSRNFGKEAALYAGLEHAHGAYIGIIDCDLQQRPQTLLDMYKVLISKPNYDCVAAYQENRKKGLTSALSAKFYKFLSKTSADMDVVDNASDFRVFKRSVAQALLSMPETYRFSKGMFAWIGFKTFPFPYTPDERLSGQTKWSLSSLFKYALNGLLSFTIAPLRAATIIGFIASAIAVVYLIYLVIKTLVFGVDLPGFATTISLILLFGGLQLFFLGIAGEYIGRIYIQGKHRPIYIAKEEICLDCNNDDQKENSSS